MTHFACDTDQQPPAGSASAHTMTVMRSHRRTSQAPTTHSARDASPADSGSGRIGGLRLPPSRSEPTLPAGSCRSTSPTDGSPLAGSFLWVAVKRRTPDRGPTHSGTASSRTFVESQPGRGAPIV